MNDLVEKTKEALQEINLYTTPNPTRQQLENGPSKGDPSYLEGVLNWNEMARQEKSNGIGKDSIKSSALGQTDPMFDYPFNF
jgi:hypothetical protein